AACALRGPSEPNHTKILGFLVSFEPEVPQSLRAARFGRSSGGGTLEGSNSLASRANHTVPSRSALLCAAALACAILPCETARGGDGVASAPASGFPTAVDARLAGDAKQTRFVLDLDRSVTFRAFTLSDPYRVVIDIPQVSFHLPAG